MHSIGFSNAFSQAGQKVLPVNMACPLVVGMNPDELLMLKKSMHR